VRNLLEWLIPEAIYGSGNSFRIEHSERKIKHQNSHSDDVAHPIAFSLLFPISLPITTLHYLQWWKRWWTRRKNLDGGREFFMANLHGGGGAK